MLEPLRRAPNCSESLAYRGRGPAAHSEQSGRLDRPSRLQNRWGDIWAQESLLITVRWQVPGSMDNDDTLSIRLVGPDNRIYAQEDSFLHHGGLLTSAWQVGQLVTYL